MKLSPKEYREFYIGCVNMYEAIDSDDAFKILKEYYPDTDKESFLKDVKSRYGKFTKGYTVWSTKKRNVYIICSEFCASEDLDALFAQAQNKPFYTPETLNKFFHHSSYEYWRQTNINDIKNMEKILTTKRKDFVGVAVHIMFDDLKTMSCVESADLLSMTLKRLMIWGFEFEEKELEIILKALQNIINNTRLPSNRGYTPNELSKMHGPIDPNKISLTLGPNIKRMLEEGELDVDEYIQSVLTSNIPENAKQSMLKELIEIKNNIEKSQA